LPTEVAYLGLLVLHLTKMFSSLDAEQAD
jgi:hypothetical protein